MLASFVEFERKRNDVRVCSFIGRSFHQGTSLFEHNLVPCVTHEAHVCLKLF